MERNTKKPLLEKKGEYWYVDRKGEYWYVDRSGKRVRKLLNLLMLSLSLMVVMYTGACGGDMTSSLVQDYQSAYGTDSRETSDLLSTTTDRLSSTTTTLTSTTDMLLEPVVQTAAASVSARVALENAETAIYLSSGESLQDARVVLSSGSVQGYSLGGTSARVAFAKQNAWTHLAVTTKSGGKWYFDTAGNHLPGGYQPRISVTPGGLAGSYIVNSTDAVSHVRFFQSDGSESSGAPDKFGRINAPGPVSFMIVGAKYDSSGKWYFDRSGQPLPNGYCPAVTFAWKNNSLYVESSDAFDKAVLFYTDYTKDTFSTSGYTAWLKPFRGKTVDGIYIRLKGDGSKWYFDSAGMPCASNSKWFSDVD